MCARYYLDNEVDRSLFRIFGGGLKYPDKKVEKDKDICPSDEGLIIIKSCEGSSGEESPDDGGSYEGELLKWGYPCYDGKGLIINARIENIEERKSFSNGIKNNRCLIPASGFYEWDDNKDRVTFKSADSDMFLFGGIYDIFNGEKRFAIITCDANDSMKPVHDRMPFVIPASEKDKWLSGEFRELYDLRIPEFKVIREFEQMSLF
ncbi:MAG: SOS response-associated peptidase [Lachnospiraceae bacterium]|nr:SOS response-associated peptidase [Lachnospiraceae bacterium]